MRLYEKQLTMATIAIAILIILFNLYHIFTNTVPEGNYEISENIKPLYETGEGIAQMLTNPTSSIGMVIIIILFCALYSLYKKPNF